MALSLAEKAERDIAKLEKAVEKVSPRYDSATLAINKKREIFAKRAAALEVAEQKYQKLASRKEEAERYIKALREAIGSGEQNGHVDAVDAAQLVLSLNEDDEDEDVPQDVDDVDEDDVDDEDEVL